MAGYHAIRNHCSEKSGISKKRANQRLGGWARVPARLTAGGSHVEWAAFPTTRRHNMAAGCIGGKGEDVDAARAVSTRGGEVAG